ncbi:MAG TPA: OmpA family protein [Puia sp.]|nr:OmpA family protein [Puia sp.]
MIRKIVVAIIGFAFLAVNAGAQELNVWVDGGWQGLSYKVQNGHSSLSPFGSLGLGYTFPLARHWNILTGVAGGYYGTKATLGDGKYSFPQVDATGSAFEYNVGTTGYKETQRFFSFGVPLLLQYHSSGRGTQWYVNGGGKLLLPFNADVKASAAQLNLTGYYPDFNEVLSNLPQHGFGTLNNWSGSSTYKLKTAAALRAEAGLSFPLSGGTRLYTGVYAEYGLSNMKGNTGSSSLVSYDASGLTTVQAGSVLNVPGTGNVKLLSFGIQVKVGFGRGKRAARSPQAAPVPIPQAPTTPAPTPTQPTPGQAAPTQPATPAQPAPTSPAPTPPSSVMPDSEAVKTLQRTVVFGVLNKVDVPESLKSHLDTVADILNRYPDIRIAITGHTCSIGTERENIKIGEARALAVAAYLQRKGVDPGRMDVHSAGESDPLVPNNSPAHRSRNRRVTVQYIH